MTCWTNNFKCSTNTQQQLRIASSSSIQWTCLSWGRESVGSSPTPKSYGSVCGLSVGSETSRKCEWSEGNRTRGNLSSHLFAWQGDSRCVSTAVLTRKASGNMNGRSCCYCCCYSYSYCIAPSTVWLKVTKWTFHCSHHQHVCWTFVAKEDHQRTATEVEEGNLKDHSNRTRWLNLMSKKKKKNKRNSNCVISFFVFSQLVANEQQCIWLSLHFNIEKRRSPVKEKRIHTDHIWLVVVFVIVIVIVDRCHLFVGYGENETEDERSKMLINQCCVSIDLDIRSALNQHLPRGWTWMTVR